MFPTSEIVDDRLVKKINTKAGEWKVLRRGGVFGPNASGKTSFMESIYFAKHFVVDGQKSGQGIGIDQFKSEIGELDGKKLWNGLKASKLFSQILLFRDCL